MKTTTLFSGLFLAVALFFNNNIQAQNVVLVANTQDEAKHTTTGSTIVSVYQENMAITAANGKFGFMNKQGVEVIAPRFENARMFRNSYAAVQTQDGWTFINKQGKRITAEAYNWVGDFSIAGIAPVQINGKWGFINEQGQAVTAAKYDKVHQFGPEGTALVKYGNRWFVINEQGVEMPADAHASLMMSSSIEG